jgi:uncharacterized membrane protein (GlpM family)
MKPTTHILVLRLRMRGTIPALPQYVFMARYVVKSRGKINEVRLSE